MRKEMERIAGLLTMCMVLTVSATAANHENTIYKVVIADIAYTPKEEKTDVGHTILKLGKAALTGETTKQLDQYADAVRETISQGIADVRRLRLTDNSDEYQYYVDGTITNITTTDKLITPADKSKKSYTGYKAQLRVTLNLHNAADGSVTNTGSFSTTEYSTSGWSSSREEAVNKALEVIRDDVDSYFEHCFPLYAKIEEAGEVKKDKQKELYIDLGSNLGIVKGDEFLVQEKTTIGSKEAHTDIGRVKVVEVMGDEVSRCKVTKGGDKIKAALDSGATLELVSR
jgi:hypothetical protein